MLLIWCPKTKVKHHNFMGTTYTINPIKMAFPVHDKHSLHAGICFCVVIMYLVCICNTYIVVLVLSPTTYMGQILCVYSEWVLHCPVIDGRRTNGSERKGFGYLISTILCCTLHIAVQPHRPGMGIKRDSIRVD